MRFSRHLEFGGELSEVAVEPQILRLRVEMQTQFGPAGAQLSHHSGQALRKARDEEQRGPVPSR